MVEKVVLDGLYQHYKGNKYIVKNLARLSETLEELVVYECLYENPEGKIWVRPMKMFLETVVIDGKTTPRFKYLGEASV